ncbi:MAG: hypothetical protein RLZZ353_787 [Actinomycetota bacterium]
MPRIQKYIQKGIKKFNDAEGLDNSINDFMKSFDGKMA